ncbi:capsid cement protein [Mycolicibacterium gilvum]|uniref:capsid cement protein n=1 Tax=Mycolicibacterium gilvum TaxID=1804 RepID=UPI0040464627
MADYTPIFKPGVEVTLTASATITAGQALVVTGQQTVGPSSAVSTAFVGIAATDAASGEKVVVIGPAVHELTSTGTVNDGDQITTAAGGAVAAAAAPTEGQVIGVALADAASNKVIAKTFR